MDYCGQCGAKLGADQVFCHKCGASLGKQRVIGDEASSPAARPNHRALPRRDIATFTPRDSSAPPPRSDVPPTRTVGFAALPGVEPVRPRRRRWGRYVGLLLGIFVLSIIVSAVINPSPSAAPSHTADSSQAPAAAAIQATATEASPTDTALPTANPTDMAAMKAQITGAHICKGADYGGSMPLCGKDASSLSQADIDGGAGVSFAAPAHEPNDRFPAGSYTLTVYEIDATNTPNQIGTMPLNMQSGNGYVGWKLSDVVSIAGLTLIPDTTYELELDGPVVMGVAGQARFSYAGDGTASANALPTSDSSLASDEGGTGPTAECNDGTTSYSQHPSGTCSYHGGVAVWDDHLQHSTP